jgi:TonB family protein
MACALFALSESATFAASPQAEFQSPKVIRTVEPEFPPALLQQSIYEGEARVVLMIDFEGKLADWMITSFTHPLLAREATEALRQWKFEPARRTGEPIDVRMEMTFTFRAGGMIVSLSGDDQFDHRRHLHRGPALQPKLCRPSELDAPLQVLDSVAPMSPQSLGAKRATGRAVLDFYIDERGRARMPVVDTTDDEAFAKAAVEALSHWRFAAPTRGGLPVIVRAKQAFNWESSK